MLPMASTDRPSGLLKWGAANTEPSELPNTSGSPASSESVARLPVTVKVAALLVADPDALVKTARNFWPSEAALAIVVA